MEPDASDAEVRKAYRQAAKRNHPDKGGDAETFKKINEAWQVRARAWVRVWVRARLRIRVRVGRDVPRTPEGLVLTRTPQGYWRWC